MIFVTVGMHHQGFERLIEGMDRVASQLAEPVVMQIGASTYEPSHAEWFRFADQEQVERNCAAARIIVGHAGAGTIIAAFRYQRPLVVVPRRLVYHEHVDDHQLELARELSAEGNVVALNDPTAESLLDAIARASALHVQTAAAPGLAASIAAIIGATPAGGMGRDKTPQNRGASQAGSAR